MRVERKRLDRKQKKEREIKGKENRMKYEGSERNKKVNERRMKERYREGDKEERK